METLAVLDQILAFFDNALSIALPVLQGHVEFLFQSFLIITIVFAGATYAFGNTSVGLEFFLKKILLVSGTLFLITNWLDFTNIIVSSFGVLGLRAGGLVAAQLTTADLFSPTRIASIGFEHADVLFDEAGEQSGFLGVSFLSGPGILLIVAAFVMGLAFILIAIQVFMLLIEFKLVTLGAFILIPFALMDRTTSLAQGALGYVIAAGLKLFVIAIVISLATAFVVPLELADEITSAGAFSVMAVALTFLMLAIRAPGLAASISGAGPQLGVGAIAQTAAAVAAPVAASIFAGAGAYQATKAGARVTGAAGKLGGQMATQGNVGAAELRKAGRSAGGGGAASSSVGGRSGGGGGSNGGGPGGGVPAGPSTARKVGADVAGAGRNARRAATAAVATSAAAGNSGGGGSAQVDISSRS